MDLWRARQLLRLRDNLGPMYRLSDAAAEIISVGRRLFRNGWVPATSGNFSMRLDENRIAITVSGVDKGMLGEDDIMEVGSNGELIGKKAASAELGLHLQLYNRDADIGAVLHTHSVNATFVSNSAEQEIQIENLEILKAFSGVATHEYRLSIPVFDNTQDIASLSDKVERHMQNNGQGHAYLIRGHGLYTWGTTMQDCMRHLEALEYLLDYYRLKHGPTTQ